MASSAAMAAFFEESDTHIEVAESALLELEKSPSDADTINELFRAIHSIKGNAGLVGLTEIHVFATEMETTLDIIRSGKEAVLQEDRDKLFDYLDSIKSMVNSSKAELGIEVDYNATAGEAVAPPPDGADMDAELDFSFEPVDKVSESEEPKPAEEVKAEPQKLPSTSPEPKVEAKPKAILKVSATVPEEEEPAVKDQVVSFLTFFLGKESYGIDINDVREIIIKKDITIVPNAKPFVAGVMNLRGMVIPVVDARKRLEFSTQTDRPKEENIIVVESDGLSTGVLVDMVDDIMKFEPDMIVSADIALGSFSDGAKYIESLGKSGKSTVMLINTASFCDSEEEFF